MWGRVIAAIVALGMVLVVLGVELVMEEVPDPVRTRTDRAPKDPLRGMRFAKAKRRQNMEELGLPPNLLDRAEQRVDELEKDDLRNKEQKSKYLEAMLENPEVSGVLCPGRPEFPSRYAATAFLLEPSGGARRVVDGRQLREGFVNQETFDKASTQNLYDLYEYKTPEPAKTALPISALLLGQEREAVYGEGDWGGSVLGGAFTVESAIRKHPELETELVEYFALFHLLSEIANKRGNEFCVKSPTEEEGE